MSKNKNINEMFENDINNKAKNIRPNFSKINEQINYGAYEEVPEYSYQKKRNFKWSYAIMPLVIILIIPVVVLIFSDNKKSGPSFSNRPDSSIEEPDSADNNGGNTSSDSSQKPGDEGESSGNLSYLHNLIIKYNDKEYIYSNRYNNNGNLEYIGVLSSNEDELIYTSDNRFDDLCVYLSDSIDGLVIEYNSCFYLFIIK